MDQDARTRLQRAIERADGVPEVTLRWTLGPGRGLRLIDIREPAELAQAGQRIEGMEHIPMECALREAVDWERSAPLLLFCRSGARSGRMALALERMGFDAVASVRGGILEWHALCLPCSMNAAHAAAALLYDPEKEHAS